MGVHQQFLTNPEVFNGCMVVNDDGFLGFLENGKVMWLKDRRRAFEDVVQDSYGGLKDANNRDLMILPMNAWELRNEDYVLMNTASTPLKSIKLTTKPYKTGQTEAWFDRSRPADEVRYD